jgi:roadblock/LC7 domain-containing protein
MATVTKTSSLNDLLKLKGVVAVGEFTTDGKLVDYKATMPMTEEMAATAAQFCSSISHLFNSLSGAYTKITGMPWVPQQGWAYTGGQYTVCVAGNKGIFVETAKADFNQLFAALVGPR